jgi:ubiquinol-cytochrome c reductase cytochrome b subunit
VSGRFAQLANFIEERTGYRALVRAALDEPVAGGPRPRYVFGSLLLFYFANQAVTGFLLACGYAPSVHDAWSSVAYIDEVAPLGWFIRGMHSAGASLILAAAVLHLFQVMWAGAYRRPREVTWWIGLLLLGVLFAFSLSGYLLPWDQKGYFATQVATSLLGATPLVGDAARRLVQGGASYGNLTLTRFYAMHVLLLPSIVVTLIVAHLALFRRHGVTPPAALEDAELVARARPFYPRQALLDLGAIAIAAIVLVAWVLRTHGASLDAPADPTSSYEARPEWYFLPLFQLLRHLPGALEVVASVGVPLVVFALLAALPFLDRSPTRDARARPVPIAIVVLLLVGGVGLGLSARLEDRRDPAFVEGRARAERAASGARLRFRARLGVAPEGAEQQLRLAEALFDEHCADCHTRGGRGDAQAPTLDAWSSRAWIDAFLAGPDDARYFGHTSFHDMKPVAITGADRAAIVEWVWSQGGGAADATLVARGVALLDELSCNECHERDGKSEGHGIPNLGGRASEAWLRGLLADAGGPTYFGKKNTMPRFADKLSPVEMDAIVAWLRSTR